MIRDIDSAGVFYTVTEMVDIWNVVDPDSTTIIAGAGRCGGDVIKIIPVGKWEEGIWKTFDNRSTWYTGVAVFVSSPLNDDRQLLVRYMNIDQPEISLRILPNGQLRVYRSGNREGAIIAPEANLITLGTSTFAVKENNFYYIEFGAVIHGSAGSFEVRVNGSTVLSASGINTSHSGGTFANTIAWCSGASPTTGDLLGDFYVIDAQVSFDSWRGRLSNFIGDVQVAEVLHPNANGTQQDFTPVGTGANHFDRINDVTPNELTNYLESFTVGNEEMNEFENMSTSVTIHAIQLMARIRKSDPGNRSTKLGVRQASTTTRFYGDEHFPSVRDFQYFRQPSDWRPWDQVQWTPADVNDNQFGFKVNS